MGVAITPKKIYSKKMSDDLGAYIVLALLVGVPVFMGYRHLTDGSETKGFKFFALVVAAVFFMGIILINS